MNKAAIAEAARRLAAARLKGTPVAALPKAIRPRTAAEGYAVQKAVHRALAAAGEGEIAGYKVGATVAKMQAYLGIDSPAAGGMCANRVRPSGAAFRRADFVAVGVECEIALTLGADLPAGGALYDRRKVAGAVAACHAAIEVVDNRYKDFRAIGAPTLIADDFFHAAFVHGRPVAPGPDLAAARGALTVNGRRFGGGRGADLMGHPYAVLAWLANQLARTGQPLKAGHVVTCGSVTPVCWLGDAPRGELRVAVRFAGLGEARLRLY